MFSYYAYGLKIRSDLPLPQLRSDDGDVGNHPTMRENVFIRLQRDSCQHTDPPVNKNAYWEFTRENAALMIKGIGTFRIRQGKEISIYPVAHFNEQMIQLIVINTLMSIVLYQRNMLVLHASSVRIDGSGVAFLGASGAGKSLIAGALCARGHSLVTDDVAPVRLFPAPPRVYPGYPMIKMNPYESAMLGFPDQTNKLLHDKEQKYGCSVSNGFSILPCPLSHIFVLAVAEGRMIQRLSPREAFIQLIPHSPPAIWDLLPDQHHFYCLGALIEKVPIFKLTREDCLEALPEHARMIEEYLQKEKRVKKGVYA